MRVIFRHIEYLDEKLKLTSGESNQKMIVSKNISGPIKRQYEEVHKVDKVNEVNLEEETDTEKKEIEKEKQDFLNEIEN